MAAAKKDIMDTLIETVIFAALIGVIATSIAGVGANVSGAAAVLLGLTVLFIVINFIRGLVPTKSKR